MPKAEIVTIQDIDTLVMLSDKCRRKHLEAKTPHRERKYRRMLLVLNERLEKYHEGILASHK